MAKSILKSPSYESKKAATATVLAGVYRILSSIAIGVVFFLLPLVLLNVYSDIYFLYLFLVSICIFLAAFFAYKELRIGWNGARQEEKRLRSMLLTRYFRSEREHDKPGELVSLLADALERLTDFRQLFLGSTIASFLVPPIICLFIAIFIHPFVGLGILIFLPFVPLSILSFMKLFRKVSAGSRSERARLAVKYLDALRNLIPILLFGAGERFEETLKKQGEANRVAVMKLLARNQIVILVVDGVFFLALMCWSLFLMIMFAEKGEINEPQAAAIIFLLTLLLEPLRQVAAFFYIGMGGMAAQGKVSKFFAQNPLPDSSSDRAIKGTNDPSVAIELKDISFSYGDKRVLDNIDLQVPFGAKIAIMGASGNGKSTLLSILQGQKIPQTGSVHSYQSQDLNDLCVKVTQNTQVFYGSLADNLRIAREDATEEEMWKALEKANLATEVRAMSLGIDSTLGERGNLLSGGQIQRLSLARAFLSQRKVLLLDEPTSHIDMGSEEAIISAIKDLGDDITVVVVTHRPSTALLADTIFELKDHRLTPIDREGIAHV